MYRTPLACQESDSGSLRIHQVRGGDTLHRIIREVYGGSPASPAVVIQQIQQDNPHVTNPDLIHPGELLLLRVPFHSKPLSEYSVCDFRSCRQSWLYLDGKEKELAEPASRILEFSTLAENLMVTFASVTSDFLAPGQEGMKKILKLHGHRRSGDLTKGQYDYRRLKELKEISRRLGSLTRVIGKGNLRKHIRLVPGRSADPTEPLRNQINKIRGIAIGLRLGGFVVSFFSLGSAIRQDHADTQNLGRLQARNTLSTGAAIAASAGLSKMLALVVIPSVGKIVLIAIVVVAVGMLVEHCVGKVYDAFGNEYPIIEICEEVGVLV